MGEVHIGSRGGSAAPPLRNLQSLEWVHRPSLRLWSTFAPMQEGRSEQTRRARRPVERDITLDCIATSDLSDVSMKAMNIE